jgi:hypothetical protein
MPKVGVKRLAAGDSPVISALRAERYCHGRCTLSAALHALPLPVQQQCFHDCRLDALLVHSDTASIAKTRRQSICKARRATFYQHQHDTLEEVTQNG